MRQGERRGTEVDLLDFTYDGKIKDRFLSGGLGKKSCHYVSMSRPLRSIRRAVVVVCVSLTHFCFNVRFF